MPRTRIVADPRIPVRVKHLDYAEADPAEVVELFEAGWILVFDDFPLPFSLAWLRSLPVWPDTDWTVKKAKMRFITESLTPKNFKGHFLAKLVETYERAAEFQRHVLVGAAAMTAAFRRLFPDYSPTGQTSHSWRLGETFPEGLHLDSYDDHDDELTRVRLFYNYDDVPRIWTTAGAADELLLAHHACLSEADLKAHPNTVNDRLTKKIPWPTVPRHHVLFAPGSLWVCDSQLVSHEIFYGRRGWAHTYTVDPASLLSPKNNFQARMRKALKEISP